MKNILIVAAHPDDEVLGCFATVSKLINKGYTAYTLVLSKGKTSRNDTSLELNHKIEQIVEEAKKANKIIGIKELFFADFPDNTFDSVPLLNIIIKITEIKEKIKPEIIFTHHIGDLNIDHKITHTAVITATRPIANETVNTIYTMEVPSSTEWSFSAGAPFIPNVFFDVKDTIDLKLNAMAAYKSELRDYPHPRSLQYIKELARLNGAKIGVEYSENFMLIRDIYK